MAGKSGSFTWNDRRETIMLIRRCTLYFCVFILGCFSYSLHTLSVIGDRQLSCTDSHSRFTLASTAMLTDSCEHFRSFSNETDCMLYLRLLCQDQRYNDLKAIAQSDAWHCEFAAWFLSDALPTAEAIAYCRTFRPGSLQWVSAVSALWKKDRGLVVNYFGEMLSTCDDPYAKVTCYHVCQRANWDDVVSYARNDIANTEPLCPEFNADPTECTVGDVARHYCESVACENAPRSQIAEKP